VSISRLKLGRNKVTVRLNILKRAIKLCGQEPATVSLDAVKMFANGARAASYKA